MRVQSRGAWFLGLLLLTGPVPLPNPRCPGFGRLATTHYGCNPFSFDRFYQLALEWSF